MADLLNAAACLIHGETVTARSGSYVVVNPFTEQAIGMTPEAGAELVDEAVQSATAAFNRWRDVDVEERAALLERVADLLEDNADRIVETVSREMGMPVTLARATQSELPASVLRATAAVARRFPWREETDGATLLRSGAGVVGAVTPWNMPVHQIIAKVAAAVAAGCSVVLKASEQTPYDASIVAGLFLEAGAPPGLFNVVTGTGPVTGAALTGHPDLSRVSFTGSVRAGREVAKLAAETLTRCALELGGKSPAVLLPDAELDRAIPAALASGFVNSGQACNAPTRLLLPKTLLAEASDRIVQAVDSLVLGDPGDPSTQQGPLVTERQRAAVLAHIGTAQDQGGQLLTGTGKPSERCDTGWFVDPTVITGLAEDADAVRQEIFGPVIVVQTYDDVDDAVRIANDSEYGLSAEVWAQDAEAAARVAGRLAVGQVKVNGVKTRNRPTVPFGGMRNSGYGRELGPLGVEEFTEVTAVMA